MTIIRIFTTFILLGQSILFAQNYITATKVLGNVSSIGPKSKAWLSADFTEIALYPQTTIKNIDTNGTWVEENNSAIKARVKSIYDGKNISFLLEWKDKSKNIQDENNVSMQSDKFALQFAKNYEDVDTLPYIGMGNIGRRVVIYATKLVNKYPDIDESIGLFELFTLIHTNQLDTNKSIQPKNKIFEAEGFSLIKEIKEDKSNSKINMLYKDGKWLGTLSIKMKSEVLNLDASPFPISFAVWDGDKNQTNTMEVISPWIGVKLLNTNTNKEFLKALAQEAKGNVKNGKREVEKNCIVCHRFNSTKIAPDFMAPNLSNIGGYSTKEYLMESVVTPSAVLVLQNNSSSYEGFDWFNLDKNNKKISAMPSFDWMDEETREDIVAFLKTLKADIKKYE